MMNEKPDRDVAMSDDDNSSFITHHSPLIPRLRFPEFREAGEWNEDKLVNLISIVTPPKKLLSEEYFEEGKYPVIDQSQSFICGWTNDQSAIIRDNLPLVIFGDHTCVLKLVADPFAQGADGIKILKTRRVIEPQFLFQYLQSNPVVMESYKRHFSTLKEKLVTFPEIISGEQQKIADCLSSIDALITAHSQKLDALKAHKKGLMQQLFPREGETVPRLRFPEFRDAGEWEGNCFYNLLDDVLDFRGRTPKKLGMDWGGGDIVSLSANNVKNGYIDFKAECNLGSKELHEKWMGKVSLDQGDIVFTMEAPLGNALLVPDSKPYILSQRVVAFKTKRGVNNGFLIQLIWSSQFQSEITKLSTGSTAKGISQKTLKKIKVSLPKKKEEQQKIANCLASIDALITAQGKKIEAVKVYKKGLMQQLFPVLDEVRG